MGFKGLCCVLGVVSSVACAFDRDEREDYATPALEQGMDNEGVYGNAEEYGKCIEGAARAARDTCGGGPSHSEVTCRLSETAKNREGCERADARTDRTERSFKVGGEAKADKKGPSAGGSMEYRSK